MSRIRSSNTTDEIKFRKFLWNKKVRGYRIKNNKLPGKPDLYFPKHKIAVFIDGCFWHKCPECFKPPKSKIHYWDKKIKKNTIRDQEVNVNLINKGITVLRFWEHQVTKNIEYCFNVFLNSYEKNLRDN